MQALIQSQAREMASMQTDVSEGTEKGFRPIEPEQHTAAKLVGLLYLLQMATAIFAESFLRGRVLVRGDAMQTAANMVASEGLFRLSLVSDLITYASVIILVWALYIILKPVNNHVALLAVFFRLVENSILAGITVIAFAELALLSGADYLRAFDAKQLPALV